VSASPEQRAADLGLDVVQPLVRPGNFDFAVRSGDLVYVSGCIALDNGSPAHCGTVGDDVDVATAQQSARLAGVSVLTALRTLTGSLDAVRRVVRLTGYVRSAPTFVEQPKVVNGASDLMVEVFGDEAGRHARSAIGVYQLPFGASVEVEGIFEVGGR
jgi:enamine deaminase RidA (YjgF/YER057c/UK114 family)